MLLRRMSKWVWVSFTLALVGGVSMAACGDDLSPTPTPTSQSYIPNPNYTPASYPAPTRVSSRVAHARGVYSNCGPFYNSPDIPGIIERDYTPRILAWTQDGNRIIFDNPRVHSFGGRQDDANGWDIHFLDAGGSYLHRIVDANPEYLPHHGVYADVSPDGSRIVYASCEYPTGPEVHHNVWDRERYDYEIVVRKIDGADPRRLTENVGVDHFPVWSPDGSRIAFVGNGRLSTIAPDGSGLRDDLVPHHIGLGPPAWSPDGGSLAFFAGGAAYIVGADGSHLTRLSAGGGMVAEAPVWSPDGSLVAFGRSGEDISDIVVSTPDGSDQRAIVGLKGISLWTSDGSDVRFSAISESTDSGEQRVAADLVASSIAWSPDGSEIRFVAAPESMESDEGASAYAGIFSVGVDGTGMRIIAEIEWPSLVSWSPEGSRFVVRRIPRTWTYYSSKSERILTPEVVLYMMSSDGSGKRVLVSRIPGRFVAEHSDWRDPTDDIVACSQGYVVPDPEDNPGLVRDCETLLRSRRTLAGDGFLNWSAEVPITEWDRVRFVDFSSAYPNVFPTESKGQSDGDIESSPRVRGLAGLITGTLSPALGGLTELEWLWLLGPDGNSTGGPILPELGNLTKLTHLIISNGALTGSIPLELGNLSNLKRLDLSDNALTGSIPLELGNLSNLEGLYLRTNPRLTGEIPLEVWNLWRTGALQEGAVEGTSLRPPKGECEGRNVWGFSQCLGPID